MPMETSTSEKGGLEIPSNDENFIHVMANAQFLLARYGWNSGSEAVDADGMECDPLSKEAVRFCIVGAIKRSIADLQSAAGGEVGKVAQQILERFVKVANLEWKEEPMPGEPNSKEHVGITFWQDGATERIVADKITEAIALAKQSQ